MGTTHNKAIIYDDTPNEIINGAHIVKIVIKYYFRKI